MRRPGAAKNGLDLAKTISVVSGGAAKSWQLENLGPKMAAGPGVDQLGVDAHLLAGPARAAFEDVAYAEFLRDLRRRHG